MLKKDTVISQNATLGTVFSFAKKGISPVVATSLLLVVAVVAVVGFQSWYQTFSSNLFVNAEQDSGNLETSGIETIIGDTLYLKAGNNLTVESVKIDGNDCGINGTYSGTQGLDVSDCLSQTNSVTPEIVMITDDKVEAKKVFISDTNINLGSEQLSEFIFQINVSYPGFSGVNNFTLFLDEQGNHNFTVDWGDNTTEIITSWNQSEVLHQYSSGGVYNVTLEGVVDGFSFGTVFGFSDGPKLIDVFQWDDLFLSRNGFQFVNATNLNSFSALDSPTVENMTGMFAFTENFNDDLSSWNTNSVTDMSDLFVGSINFTADLSSWDTRSLEIMEGLFVGSINFTGDLSSWDTSSVIDMSDLALFSDNFNGNLSNWNLSSVLFIDGIFQYANNPTPDISNWDVSNVTNMSGMFIQSTFNGDISGWDISNVEYMSGMFVGSSFNGDISNWDISNVEYMSGMFVGSSFNGDISNWNTSNVKNMSEMFGESSFNGDISNWNISNVKNMAGMFYYATSFNQNLSGWNLSNVEYCFDFDNGATSWQENFKPNISSCSGEFGGGGGGVS